MKTDAKRKMLGPRKRFKIEEFRLLCALQPTEDELAFAYGICKRTIIRLLKKPEYRQLWEAGKAGGKLSLRRLQWRQAQQLNSAGVTMTIHLSKHWLGETEKAAIELSGRIDSKIEVSSAGERLNRKLDAIAERLTGRVAGIAAAAGASLAPAGVE